VISFVLLFLITKSLT